MTLIPEPYIPPGPRALKERGSWEWCWQTLGMLKRYMSNIDREWREAASVFAELESENAWEVIGYLSLNQLCEDQVGVPERVVRGRIDAEKIDHHPDSRRRDPLIQSPPVLWWRLICDAEELHARTGWGLSDVWGEIHQQHYGEARRRLDELMAEEKPPAA